MGKSFFIVAALVLTLGCAKAQVDPVSSLNSVDFESITLEIGGKHYEVEYAKTFEQRAQGLMFRKALCEDCGMFFKFSSPKICGHVDEKYLCSSRRSIYRQKRRNNGYKTSHSA